MKFSRSCLAMFLIATILVACQTTPQAGSTTASASHVGRILASGELRVGTSANQPPLNMKDREGQIFGLEIDLAHILAKSMGVKLRLV